MSTGMRLLSLRTDVDTRKVRTYCHAVVYADLKGQVHLLAEPWRLPQMRVLYQQATLLVLLPFQREYDILYCPFQENSSLDLIRWMDKCIY